MADDNTTKPDFQETVRAEIEAEQTRAEWHERENANWQLERQSLAPDPALGLTPNFASDDPQEVEREYNRRQEAHLGRQAGINFGIDQQVETIRAQGQTLTKEFSDTASDTQNPQAGLVEYDAPDDPGLAQIFEDESFAEEFEDSLEQRIAEIGEEAAMAEMEDYANGLIDADFEEEVPAPDQDKAPETNADQEFERVVVKAEVEWNTPEQGGVSKAEMQSELSALIAGGEDAEIPLGEDEPVLDKDAYLNGLEDGQDRLIERVNNSGAEVEHLQVEVVQLDNEGLPQPLDFENLASFIDEETFDTAGLDFEAPGDDLVQGIEHMPDTGNSEGKSRGR